MNAVKATLGRHALRLALAVVGLCGLWPASALAASPAWRATAVVAPTHIAPGGQGRIIVLPVNIGGAASSGQVSVTVGPLPAGFEIAGDPTGLGWACPTTGTGQTSITCNRADSIGALEIATPIHVPIRTVGAAPSTAVAPVSVDGGGANANPFATTGAKITVSEQDAPAGIAAFWAGAFDADGNPYTQAGGHPHSAGTLFLVNTIDLGNDVTIPAGDPRDISVDLPPGFVVNPTVTTRCPDPLAQCPPNSAAVGNAVPFIQALDNSGPFPIINNEPRWGDAARLNFAVVDAYATIVGSLRSDSDYGATALAQNTPPEYRVRGAYVMLEGAPADALGKAFVTNPTECSGVALPTSLIANTWQNRVFSNPFVDSSPPVTGCDEVPFEPSTSVTPTSSDRDSASGLDVELSLPQDGLLDPNGTATSHLKKTVVKLPEGFSVNPSGATGLAGCSDAQIGLKSKAEVACPDASKIGTASVTSPLVDQPLAGEMYLGTPKSTDPMSGEMLRLFLVVRNERYGLLVKLPGSAVADPSTGRLTATFDENPRVPFDHLEVKVRGGDRGLLATSQTCGSVASSSTLSPWSGTADVTQISPFEVFGDCSPGFAPSLHAGMDSQQARGSGTFSFRMARPQGDQTLGGLTARLPKGLLASVKDVPLCSDSQAASAACPAASKIGVVDAKAGSGDPFVLEEKGEVFLTEGYKGGAYGLAVKIRGVAGPFRGATELSPIVVRQAIHVDPATAEVFAISDPFPQIHHGVPLRVREVTVLINRGGFMLNPSDCEAKQVGADIASAQGAVADRSVPFHAARCARLAFKPKLSLRLTGRKQVRTGKHPGVRAQVTQKGVSEAGIEKAVVRLPKSLALDPDNAQALCEFTDGTKPDLENHCPKGSIVGRARAKTPLLRNDLAGNVYFVKNVRRDPDTGNEIRTLPMIIVALRGEIAINLRGESSTTKSGKLVNTFASVPDAPITRFNLNISGGRNGILTVTRTRRARINLCARHKSHIAETEMDGHNSRRFDRDVRMKTPCGKKSRKTRAQKRKAAKRGASALADGVGRG